jgi:hypothetical protein
MTTEQLPTWRFVFKCLLIRAWGGEYFVDGYLDHHYGQNSREPYGFSRQYCKGRSLSALGWRYWIT